MKPWTMLFTEEYLIPYKEMRRVDPEDEKLILKDGREIPLFSWFLYNFLSSEQDAGRLKKLLKVVHDFIEGANGMEAEGEEMDWVLRRDRVEL